MSKGSFADEIINAGIHVGMTGAINRLKKRLSTIDPYDEDRVQTKEGQVPLPRPGVISARCTAVARRAKKQKRGKENFVVEWPVGQENRLAPYGTIVCFGAVPCKMWTYNSKLFEFSPDYLVTGYFPSSATAQVDADWLTRNLVPFHEVYAADPATLITTNAWNTYTGVYNAGPPVNGDQLTDYLRLAEEYRAKRLSGTAFYCTLKLDLVFLLPYSSEESSAQKFDYRVRIVMLQVNEETSSAVGPHGYELSDFYDFMVNTAYNSTEGLETTRKSNYKKDEQKETQMVAYTVLIDQVMDLKDASTSRVAPHLTLEQRLGPIPINQTTDVITAQPTVELHRAGRVLWGIFQLNQANVDAEGRRPSSWVYTNQIQWHGRWKVMISDSNI